MAVIVVVTEWFQNRGEQQGQTINSINVNDSYTVQSKDSNNVTATFTGPAGLITVSEWSQARGEDEGIYGNDTFTLVNVGDVYTVAAVNLADQTVTLQH